ncbi:PANTOTHENATE KINASE [Salix viminalis]|uniref:PANTOTHENATE KINASE n=1 Tax=Salix viminalis TaxID=40686 RepID=A0A9Q0NLC2_SALVM|nr:PANTOTHENATE KINASE [Salix viminalis]
MTSPEMGTWLLLLSLFCFNAVFFTGADGLGFEVEARRPILHRSSLLFDVKRFGARADGRTDDSKAFIAAWKEACRATGKVKLLVPKGVYLIGPVKFAGPCKNVSSLTVYMKGYLKATAKLSRYGSGTGWVEFGWLERLTLTGGGTFDGQGAKAWPYNNCTTDSKCKLLPTNVKFVAMNQTVVQGITSLNSKFFHIALVECKNFKGTEIKISAPADSPNTDGIHVERSSNVCISRSLIGTGDDCISIGQGNSQVTITRIRCGPGHGISVGSLGRYENEGDVSGLVVRDCAISGTMNGIRIKTWANSPGSSAATNMTFENIVMKNVTNPIIIDQSYCPFSSCISTEPSKVKLSDIYFKQIRGTSSSAVAVALECSEGIPCQNIFLENVHLELSTGEETSHFIIGKLYRVRFSRSIIRKKSHIIKRYLEKRAYSNHTNCTVRTFFRFELRRGLSSAQKSMESESEMVAFPLLLTPIESNYRACTIPYRFPSDNPKKPTPTELQWIDLFLNSIPSFKKRAESDTSVPDAPVRAEKFAQRYGDVLEDFKKDPESHGGPPDCILLCRLREIILRELGFIDIFKRVKDEENAKAISLFKDVVQLNDAIEDDPKRLENLVRGIFAGNIFDLGSAELAEVFSKDGMSFLASCQNLVPRPWVIDDLDAFKVKWSKKSWKKVVIFVDNSGADIILGILPFARELLRHGTQVVLAANDMPSINDVTYTELIEIIAKLKDENGQLMGVDTSNLLIANSGNDLPVIDLTRVSQVLAYLASDADLVVLEGMGRGIETNLYAQFKCDSLKIGMVKHPEVAQFLGGRLYDCVFKYNEVVS